MFDCTKSREKVQEYKLNINELIKQKLYAYERYNLEFGMMLVCSETPIDLDVCREIIRLSDDVYALEDTLVVVVFDMADPENAIKAAQNFLYAYHQIDFRQELFMVVSPIQQYSTTLDVSSQLFMLLEHAIKESLKNCVVDIHLMHS